MNSDKSKEKPKRALTREKVTKFLDKQGFYIVLFVCVAIIGTTAYMTSGKNKNPLKNINENRKNIESPKDLADKDGIDPLKKVEEGKIDIKVRDSVGEPTKDHEGKAEATGDEKDKAHSVREKNTPKAKDDEAEETLASNSKGKGEGQKSPSSKKEESSQNATGGKASYPVQGKVLKAHSMDELVYSNTLKEWTTHPGMDIEAFVGAEVKAAMAGVVEEIIEDSLMGITIALDHGNGLKTYYANLSTGNMVTVGQKVDKGQIISGVGRTATSEILDNPHLHFEVIKDGKSVDPTSYLN